MRVALAASVLALAALGGVLAACTARQITLTERSAVEQELLVRSLERAVANLDTRPFEGRRVTLELHALTKDQAFARAFVRAQLEERGVAVVDEAGRADLELRAFATALGVDRGETLLGIPTMQMPVFAVPIPEIALFKWARHRGLSEVEIYAFERDNGRFLSRVPAGVGRSKFDAFTILILVNFTVSDLDERPAGRAPAAAAQ
jgi:hypothetical protein